MKWYFDSWTTWPFSFIQIYTTVPVWEREDIEGWCKHLRSFAFGRYSGSACKYCTREDKIEELLFCLRIESADERGYCIENHGFALHVFWQVLCENSAIRGIQISLLVLNHASPALDQHTHWRCPAHLIINLPWGCTEFSDQSPSHEHPFLELIFRLVLILDISQFNALIWPCRRNTRPRDLCITEWWQ